MDGWTPVATHWARSEVDWLILLLPLSVVSAAMAGWWLAQRKRRRQRTARERVPPTEVDA